MKSPEEIIQQAIKEYRPVKFVLMVSGGHDSVTSAHVIAGILKDLKKDFVVYHGDTTIGIPETQEYVKMICNRYGWNLRIRKPPDKNDYYDSIVKKYGFPGRSRKSHQLCYRKLKERALRRFTSYECKSSLMARENELLTTGVRRSESKIRMGYRKEVTKDCRHTKIS